MAEPSPGNSILNSLILFVLKNKLIAFLLLIAIFAWGWMVAPFDWNFKDIPRDPIPVDAIPDYGENQQIVFTEWKGRSPRDVEDQVTYPLTVSLLGMPGVKSVRSYSYFGFSSVYVIFEDSVEFYWSRTRILEKLASLPPNVLPEGVKPTLGPDATPLGQIFQYTLQGRDSRGQPAGGWDLEELRSIQDWNVRFSLMSVEGVSEVSSIGGFVKEYQIDVDPDALRAHRVSLEQVFSAVRNSNADVGARTIEINRAEYVIRGLGLIKSLEDIEETVIATNDHTPIRVKEVAQVSQGPALRRGALDVEGQEAVGGIVVVRYGENPQATIERVKKKIENISDGLPKKQLADGTVSQVTIVPFYDRTSLIDETLETLNSALVEEIFVTIIVVLLMVLHLRSAILISGLLPMAVLLCFCFMKQFGVDANIVALSGIAIAIGTIVDMGIVLCENILRHLQKASPDEDRLQVIYRASTEVASAVLIAVLTTVISFLPVFTLEAAEGKLFKPLAYTKTFALLASIIITLIMIPPFAHLLFAGKITRKSYRWGLTLAALALGTWWAIQTSIGLGSILILFGIWIQVESKLKAETKTWISRGTLITCILWILVLLSQHWQPLGADRSHELNTLFVALVLGTVFLMVMAFYWLYEPLLRWCLRHKWIFLSIPTLSLILGLTIWLGAQTIFAFVPKGLGLIGIAKETIESSSTWRGLGQFFPGLGKEFMPRLSEGNFLYMPTTMPHASIGESMDTLKKQDVAIRSIPEVSEVVGKIGRADSPLDPAPISMVETIISFHPEYLEDSAGNKKLFRFENGEFSRDSMGRLIEDANGRALRQWRPHIKSENDIWIEIEKAAKIPGSTSAPRLQPIETRLVMLQTGMRAPLGIKIFGPNLQSIESTALKVEELLRYSPGIRAETVNADRVVGKPYLEIEINRKALGRHGVSIRQVQDIIEVAIGGKTLTTTIEGRERYPVRVRYARELRDNLESLKRILVPVANGAHIPLGQLTQIEYRRGPMVIKSENTQLVAYVTFDRDPEIAEVNAVEKVHRYLKQAELEGLFERPEGVTYQFAGNYENQIRATQRLAIVIPIALFSIFILLYFQFRSTWTTLIVFTGVFVAFSGGFQLLWLYSQDWFLDISIFGENLRELFQVRPYNLSVAVWVGFLALAGIATDDGVINGTYLKQTFEKQNPQTQEEIHEAVVHAGKRRIRPCLMTVATTTLALIPVLTSTGRGSDVMVPMAIPTFGGMIVAMITVFIVPTLYCLKEESSRL